MGRLLKDYALLKVTTIRKRVWEGIDWYRPELQGRDYEVELIGLVREGRDSCLLVKVDGYLRKMSAMDGFMLWTSDRWGSTPMYYSLDGEKVPEFYVS